MFESLNQLLASEGTSLGTAVLVVPLLPPRSP